MWPGEPIDETIKNLSKINRRVESSSVVFGEAVYQQRGSYGPIMQRDWQLVAIVKGSVEVKLDEGPVTISANHVALIWPGQKVHFRFAEERTTIHTWCAVRTEVVHETFQAIAPASTVVLPISSRSLTLMSQGLTVGGSGAAQEELVNMLGLSCLANHVYEAGLRPSNPGEEIARRAERLIEEHLAFPWTLTLLSEKVGVSEQHLIRIFKTHIGQTPAKYLWDLRIHRGVALLRESGLSVGDIATQVGFSSPFHFSRLVRQTYGASPREIRNQAWKGD